MGERRSRSGLGLLGRFRRDAGGAIAPLAAVVIGGMLIGTFSAIDIARLVTARNQLQDAVDSAALALARMPPSTTNAVMQAKAQAWINANVTDPDVQNLVVATPTRTTGQIQVNITAAIKTTTASLLGLNTLPFQAQSTVKYGTTHVELALVLDNTGSMNDDSKLSSLKSAASTLVNTLNASAQASGDANALKIAIVPFTETVKVGTQYHTASYTAPWLSGAMPAAYGANADAVDSSHPNRFTLLKNMYGDDNHWGGCVESRPMPYDVQETAPDPTNPATLFVPFFSPDTPDGGYYNFSNYGYGSINIVGQYDGKNYWSSNNYLADNYPADSGSNNSNSGMNWNAHQNNLSKYKTTPATNTTNYWWGDNVGPNSGCDVQAMQRLTTNTSTILNQISSMTAGGSTEIPVGLVWGWHVLSPLAPFADGAAYGAAGTIKVIVLVTDGANTYSSSYDGNLSLYTSHALAVSQRITSTQSAAAVQSALDSRLQTLCNNMKVRNADGTWAINIYTVPLEVTDTNIKSLLQGCVTDPTNYLDTTSSSQLAATFQNIAGSIQALRVAH